MKIKKLVNKWNYNIIDEPLKTNKQTVRHAHGRMRKIYYQIRSWDGTPLAERRGADPRTHGYMKYMKEKTFQITLGGERCTQQQQQ